ncbi:fido domain-containing protein [Phlyctochytrium arcticum]|nr:fido domain-containing protein [Phlyctochytrium arcticum]
MATLSCLLSADDGPFECALESLDVNNPLPFAKDYDTLVAEFLILKEKYQDVIATSPDKERYFTARSVAAWIFHSNRIEFAALESEGHTERLIMSSRPTPLTNEEQDTMASFNLLQTTYLPEQLTSTPASLAVSFDPEKLKEWHKILFNGVHMTAVGKFRDGVAFAKWLDKTQVHIYPNHEIVSAVILKLGNIVFQLLKRLDHMQDLIRRIAHLFSVASFAHFHLLDIHPFADGNGRIARFVIKRILDLEVPLPFGTFKDRDTYVGVLEKRGQEESTWIMGKLMEMMLRNACEHYKSMVETAGNLLYHHCICVLDIAQLRRRVRELQPALNNIDERKVLEAFQQLSDGETTTINLNEETRIILKRFPSLIIDDI